MLEGKPLEILSIVASFATLVCALYLFGFWSSFGINILEFVSISDILKLGIYPVVIGLLSTVIGAIIGQIMPQKQPVAGAEKEEGKISIFKKIDKHFNKIFLIILIILALFLYFQDDPLFWYICAFIFTFIVLEYVKDPKILEPIIPNQTARRFLLFVAIVALPGSFATGKMNARSILDGRSVKVVSSKIFREYGTEAFKSKALLEGQEQLKFVGAAGDYFFFIRMDNSNVYVVKYSELHFLELSSYTRPPQQ